LLELPSIGANQAAIIFENVVFDGVSDTVDYQLAQILGDRYHRFQTKLESAIKIVVKPPYRQASVLLHDLALNPYILQIIPSVGRARDVFISTIALGVLIGQPKRIVLSVDQSVAIDLFKLTPHEARVAALICAAHSTAETAGALDVTTYTIRFHLKSIFEKTCVRNRSELVSLFAMLNS